MNKSNKKETKPFLSLCMIVKNEKENLPRCLASAKPYVDEIIIVDTGSEDGTPEIAIEYGAKVSYFPWINDFSAARNYAIAQVSGEWILVLDADQELVVNSGNIKDELIAHPNLCGYGIIIKESHNQDEVTKLYTFPLFRNIPELRYRGAFHEAVTYNGAGIPEHLMAQLDKVWIIHYGFDPKLGNKKHIERNIPILASLKQKESLNFMLLYTLAGMYNETAQPEKAKECYAEALERLLPHLIEGNAPEDFRFIPSLINVLAAQALEEQDYETARLLCQRGLEWCANYPPLNYLAGATVRALGFSLGAIAYFENCLQLGHEKTYYTGEPFEISYMTTYPAYDLGSVYVDLKRFHEAIAAFELALSFDPNFTVAQEKISMIKQFLAN